jgi:hypothetical protein
MVSMVPELAWAFILGQEIQGKRAIILCLLSCRCQALNISKAIRVI